MQTVVFNTPENINTKIDDFLVKQGNHYMAYSRFGVGCSVAIKNDLLFGRLADMVGDNRCGLEDFKEDILESLNLIMIKQ